VGRERGKWTNETTAKNPYGDSDGFVAGLTSGKRRRREIKEKGNTEPIMTDTYSTSITYIQKKIRPKAKFSPDQTDLRKQSQAVEMSEVLQIIPVMLCCLTKHNGIADTRHTAPLTYAVGRYLHLVQSDIWSHFVWFSRCCVHNCTKFVFYA